MTDELDSPRVDPRSSPLQPFAGTMTRWPPVVTERPGVWDAVVKVTPLTGGRGADTHTRTWEISANWHGPGLPGLPPSPGPVDATDFVVVTELELARAVALMAVDELKRLAVPDLRALVQRALERR